MAPHLIARRRFLRWAAGSLAAGAALKFLPPLWLARQSALGGRGLAASPDTDHFFVLLRTFGGMDATLGLDPQVLPAGADERDLFLEYRPADIIDATTVKLGPAAAALAPYASSLATINGIMMRRDAGHDALNLYMLTGAGDGHSPSLAVELALASGSAPYGVLMNASTYTAGRLAVISSTQDLEDTASDADLTGLLEKSTRAAAAADSPLGISQAIVAGAGAITAHLATNLAGLKTQYGKLNPEHVIAAAFMAGASQHCEYYLTGDGSPLDTHSNHERAHLKAQKAYWDQIAAIFKLFQAIPHGTSSLFDHTTFFALSEFSRTPALNGGQGKDHNPFTNSALLAGKGIVPGTYGKSLLIPRATSRDGDPQHIGSPFDYKTGKPTDQRQGASFIFPENVAQTIARIFGSPPGFSSVAATVPSIPGIAKT